MKHTVVIERCDPKSPDGEIRDKVVAMLSKLPDIDARLGRAHRIFVKVNIGLRQAPTYLGRPFDHVDPAVFDGLASFVRERTDARVLVGDGCDGIAPAEAARRHGHMAIIDEAGFVPLV